MTLNTLKCNRLISLGLKGLSSIPWALRFSWLENAYSVFMSTFSATLTRKVDQTDLVFGMQSSFISRSVHATLRVSVYSS